MGRQGATSLLYAINRVDIPAGEDETLTKDSCPSCGSIAQPGAIQCAVCGARLSESPIQGNLSNEVGGSTTNNTITPVAPPAAPASAATSQTQPTQPVNPTGHAVASGVYSYPAYPAYPAYPTNPTYQAAPGAYAYPTGGYAPYGYPAAYGGYGGYGPYGYYGYYAPVYPMKPRRAPGEIYALVIAWIVTILAGLSVLCGLLGTLIVLLAFFTGQSDDLSFLGYTLGFSLGPIFAGGLGLWYGIRGIMRRPSPRFQLPPAWIMLGLTLAAIGGALALWTINQRLDRAPGAAFGVFPLAILTGVLPALAILAFTTQRLRNPSTRRHVWMSLFYGMTLAPLIAVILEGILSLIIIAALGLIGQDAQTVLSPATSGGQISPRVELGLFLVLSVVAPLVEEGVKPLGALLAVRRLRTPGEMFLVGLAGGIGFDIFETVGYIGLGQADWVAVSIERIGAGLLHGVGAGMVALGWYYLINGKGVRLRWLRAAGCFLYAVLQHGIFNSFALAGQHLPQNINDWLNAPYPLGTLPMQRMDAVYLVVYALILAMLIFMTSRLLHAKGMPERPAPPAPSWPASGYPYAPYPAIPWGYGLAPAPASPASPASQEPQAAGSPR
jgi:RsiW-degrading membrane proteinase PrsW (M82 family)